MTRTRQGGFTLIELILFIVMVGVGLAGILSVMNTVVKSSADPLVRKQVIAMAGSIMEEIMLRAYEDPDGLADSGSRVGFDDVSDHAGKIKTTFTDLPPALSGYAIAITVAPAADFRGVIMKKLTVTVSRGDESVNVASYRAEGAAG